MVQIVVQLGQKMYYIDFYDSSIKEVIFYSFIDTDIYNKNRRILVQDLFNGNIINATYNKDVFFKRVNARHNLNDQLKINKTKEINEIQRGNSIRNQVEIEKRTFRLYD